MFILLEGFIIDGEGVLVSKKEKTNKIIVAIGSSAKHFQ